MQAVVADGVIHKQWFENDESADAVYKAAAFTYLQFPERAKLIRRRSIEVSDIFEAASLDFVYIDGDHSYESVLADIGIWRMKIREGGVLLGDDFTWKGDLDNVGKAVAQSFGFDYGVMADTWFWRKPCE